MYFIIQCLSNPKTLDACLRRHDVHKATLFPVLNGALLPPWKFKYVAWMKPTCHKRYISALRSPRAFDKLRTGFAREISIALTESSILAVDEIMVRI